MPTCGRSARYRSEHAPFGHECASIHPDIFFQPSFASPTSTWTFSPTTSQFTIGRAPAFPALRLSATKAPPTVRAQPRINPASIRIRHPREQGSRLGREGGMIVKTAHRNVEPRLAALSPLAWSRKASNICHKTLIMWCKSSLRRRDACPATFLPHSANFPAIQMRYEEDFGASGRLKFRRISVERAQVPHWANGLLHLATDRSNGRRWGLSGRQIAAIGG